MRKIYSAVCVLALSIYSLCAAETTSKKINMTNEIKNIFPQATLLKQDDVEHQYLVSPGDDKFWLALPVGRKLNDLHFVVVFSGRGGTGRHNNISTDGTIAAGFRRKMLQNGFAFICAECSPNAWGDPESTRATLAALNHCRERGVKIPEKIDLLGFSMGGLGALMFAARNPEKVNKVVDVFGITDLETFYGLGKYREKLQEIPEAERLDRSPCSKVANYKNIEVLIIHGDDDKIVDISFSQRFYELLKKQNSACNFIVIPGIGHTNNILEKAGDHIFEFFVKKQGK